MVHMSLLEAVSYAVLPRNIESYKTQVEDQNPEMLKFDPSVLNNARKHFYVSLALSLVSGSVAYGKDLSAINMLLPGFVFGFTTTRLFQKAAEFYRHYNQNNDLLATPINYTGSKTVVNKPAVTQAEKEMEAMLTDEAIENAPTADQATLKYREKELDNGLVVSPVGYFPN